MSARVGGDEELKSLARGSPKTAVPAKRLSSPFRPFRAAAGRIANPSESAMDWERSVTSEHENEPNEGCEQWNEKTYVASETSS